MGWLELRLNYRVIKFGHVLRRRCHKSIKIDKWKGMVK